jgi:hypothetical protein
MINIQILMKLQITFISLEIRLNFKGNNYYEILSLNFKLKYLRV